MNPKLTGWKGKAGWAAAILMATIWLVAGLWKLSDISGFQVKLHQLLVPAALTLPATLLVAASEIFAGVTLLRPAWRRLGGLFSAGLLLVFMLYVGANYQTLRGEDCSCFPWLERAVGPAFFWSDAAMVAVSLVAAWFAPPVRQWRLAVRLGGAVAVLTILALGYDQLGPSGGTAAPETISVNGTEYDLHEGKVFLYFFNPTCLHCLDVGVSLSKYEFVADLIGVPTQDPDFVPGFLEDANLAGKAKVSSSLEKLKETFPFDDVPYAAALDDGRILERMAFFEEPQLGKTLRERGFIR